MASTEKAEKPFNLDAYHDRFFWSTPFIRYTPYSIPIRGFVAFLNSMSPNTTNMAVLVGTVCQMIWFIANITSS